MRRIFSGFCRNWFLIDPLHYLSSRSDFGFEFAEIFVIEKQIQTNNSAKNKPQGYDSVLLLVHVLLQEFHRHLHLRLKKPASGKRIRLRILIFPSSNKNSRKKKLDFYYFVTSLWLFIFEDLCKCTSVPNPHPDPDPYVLGPPGSVSQKYGSEDPHPNPYQNVTDPQTKTQCLCCFEEKQVVLHNQIGFFSLRV